MFGPSYEDDLRAVHNHYEDGSVASEPEGVTDDLPAVHNQQHVDDFVQAGDNDSPEYDPFGDDDLQWYSEDKLIMPVPSQPEEEYASEEEEVVVLSDDEIVKIEVKEEEQVKATKKKVVMKKEATVKKKEEVKIKQEDEVVANAASSQPVKPEFVKKSMAKKCPYVKGIDSSSPEDIAFGLLLTMFRWYLTMLCWFFLTLLGRAMLFLDDHVIIDFHIKMPRRLVFDAK